MSFMVNYRKNLRMRFKLRKKEKYMKVENFIKERQEKAKVED